MRCPSRPLPTSRLRATKPLLNPAVASTAHNASDEIFPPRNECPHAPTLSSRPPSWDPALGDARVGPRACARGACCATGELQAVAFLDDSFHGPIAGEPLQLHTRRGRGHDERGRIRVRYATTQCCIRRAGWGMWLAAGPHHTLSSEFSAKAIRSTPPLPFPPSLTAPPHFL